MVLISLFLAASLKFKGGFGALGVCWILFFFDYRPLKTTWLVESVDNLLIGGFILNNNCLESCNFKDGLTFITDLEVL